MPETGGEVSKTAVLGLAIPGRRRNNADDATGRIPTLAKLIDLPPLWLVGFAALVWGIDQVLPLSLFGALGDLLAGVLAAIGALFFGGAVRAMAIAKTTVIPHRIPQALVTSGVFRFSRNPIYLGDALFLLAAILWWDVPMALPLVPLFMLLIRERFIRDEEQRLRAGFGAAFDEWAARVRRWL
jgi:protein-S-isoprenylcysteine O-methyltransferase Ste14